MNPLVAFYEGTACDDRGRSFDDVLQFDDERLEHVHDFIQWLFPLPERSGANPSAPVLDAGAIETFRARPELRAKLLRALDRMLEFYGFARDGDRIVKCARFPGRSGWLAPGNHNHLRLTRILRSLSALGEPQVARALFDALAAVYREERGPGRRGVSDVTFGFWRAAVDP